MKKIPSLLGIDTSLTEIYSASSNNKLLRLGLKLNTAPKCTWKCPYCYVEESSNLNSYNAFKDKLFLEKTKKRLLKLKKIGVNSITINGNLEPLTAPCLKDILIFCYNHAIYTTLVTNASLLNEEWVIFLKKYNVSVLTKLNVPFSNKESENYSLFCKIQKSLSGLNGNAEAIYLKQY